MNRYPKFNFYQIITYPFSFSPLAIIFIATIFISGALSSLFIALLGSVGLGYFTLWFFKYAFYMLEQTSVGNADTPPITDDITRPFEDFRPIKLMFILIAHFMIVVNIFILSDVIAYLYALVVLIFLPAIISILVIENKLFKTFDFNILLNFITLSGRWYWESFSLTISLTLLTIVLHISGIGMFLTVFISLYFTMVVFHVVGLILYTQRKELGYVTVNSPEQTEKYLNDVKLKQNQRLAINIYAQHRQTTTICYLKEQLEGEPIEVYNWFKLEILSWNIKPKFRQEFMALYYAHLCKVGEIKSALYEYTAYIKTDPYFKNNNHDLQFILLKAAIKYNEAAYIAPLSKSLLTNNTNKTQYKAVLIDLLTYFTQTHPNDYQASKILRLLVKRFPDMQNEKLIQEYQFVLNSTV